MVTFDRIYTAYQSCVRKKGKSASALQFSYADLIDNLQSIVEDLNDRTYAHGRSSCFVNLDPCPREIFAAQFRDRVVQHFFCEELEAVFNRILIPNTTSCRLGKGTDYALKVLHDDLVRLTNKGKKGCWYLKIDLSGYFMSISRKRIINLMLGVIESEYHGIYKDELIYLAPIIYGNNPAKDKIIRCNPKAFELVPDRKRMNPDGDRGLAIGNITAQVGSNLYLNDFDHFCTDEIKVDGYVRYVDDVIILMCDRLRLERITPLLFSKLREAEVEVNVKKTIIDTVYHGVKFLGKVSFPYGYQRQAKHSAGRLLKAARTMKIDENLLSRLNSQIGRLKHYSCYNLLHDFLDALPVAVWRYVWYDDNKMKFVLKERIK